MNLGKYKIIKRNISNFTSSTRSLSLSNNFSQSSSSSSSSSSSLLSLVADAIAGGSLFNVWLRLDGGTYGSADGRAVLLFVDLVVLLFCWTSSTSGVGLGLDISGFLLRRGGLYNAWSGRRLE